MRQKMEICTQDLAACEFEAGLHWSSFEGSRTKPKNVVLLALQGTWTMCYILKSRLLFALAPSRFPNIELECQELAGRIMRLAQDMRHEEGGMLICSLYMAQSTWIAKGIIDTSVAWGEALDGRGGMLERKKFEDWCRAIGKVF